MPGVLGPDPTFQRDGLIGVRRSTAHLNRQDVFSSD